MYFDNKSAKLKFNYKLTPTKTKLEEKKFYSFCDKLSILENFPVSGHISELEIVSTIYNILGGIDYYDMYLSSDNKIENNYDMTSRVKIFIIMANQ
jgi:hypothetical protein